MADHPGVFDEGDRQFFNEHFMAIAQRLASMRLRRNSWRIELPGWVYKFKTDGYTKRGSHAWEVEQEEMREAAAAMEADRGGGAED